MKRYFTTLWGRPRSKRLEKRKDRKKIETLLGRPQGESQKPIEKKEEKKIWRLFGYGGLDKTKKLLEKQKKVGKTKKQRT